MDFSDTAAEAEFRAKARAWLSDNAPRTPREFSMEGTATLEASKEWQAKKAAAGFACLTWPAEWGGPGGSAIQQVIFAEEEAQYPVPPNVFLIGLGMCVPTVLQFGGPSEVQRFAGPAIRGEEIWCQLFSESSGGSDVAAARTSAVRAADGSGDWIINGQKVWTTGAQFSDFGIVICRTDPNVPKHRGLTMFWVDMKAPGVEVRPIHQMSGESGFNEVFFNDLRIADSQRIGAIGDGWKVSIFTLMNERIVAGGPISFGWPKYMELARQVPGVGGVTAINDPVVRCRIADWYVQSEGLRHIRNRIVTALSRGEAPGPEGSVGKIVTGLQMQDIANSATELLDQLGVVSDPETAPLRGFFQGLLLYSPGHRLAGGSDEILKNIIAERVLGLPADVRVDKDLPFKDVPIGC